MVNTLACSKSSVCFTKNLLMRSMGYTKKLFIPVVIGVLLSGSLGFFAEAKPKKVDVIKILEEGRTYNIFSSLLTASGVNSMIKPEAAAGDGFTVFAPIDQAFYDTRHFQTLPAINKTKVIGLHIVQTYLPLGKLKSYINPIEQTLASSWFGHDGYTLNITKFNGSSIAIESNLVAAHVTQILYQKNGMAVFGISKFLLPKKVFRRKDEL